MDDYFGGRLLARAVVQGRCTLHRAGLMGTICSLSRTIGSTILPYYTE